MTNRSIELEAALRLSLEALEKFRYHVANNYEINAAIAAAREVLAQQCVCGEPNSAGTHRTDGPCLAPQPQRTWIGLTNDDWDEIFGNALTIGEAIKVTEAKLKAKNFA